MTLRPHISLAVRDVNASVDFYRKLFGIDPSKQRDDYAKFEPSLGLNLSLVKSSAPHDPDGVSHFGIEVDSTDVVDQWHDRVSKAGLTPDDERGVTCCYAVLDKFWLKDPDGNPWEVFVRLADADVNKLPLETADAAKSEPCCAPTCCA